MKTREKIELILIPTVVAGIAWQSDRWPDSLTIGGAIALGCLAWLVQGGLRDAWLLYLTKTHADYAPRRKVACMCLESTAGMIGLLIGIGLALSGIGGDVAMTRGRWAGLAAAALVVGFLAKDYVVSWRPLGVRREPDHHTFIFTWRT